MPAVLGVFGGTIFGVSGAAIGTFLTTGFVGRLLTSVAISALASALSGGSARPASSGLTTEFTSAGGTTPMTFCLGRTATGGDMICPPMSHDTVLGTPLGWLTYVVGLGDIAGDVVDALIIGDEVVTIGVSVHPTYGNRIDGRYADCAFIKLGYSGAQTVADPGLIEKYATYPERPWSANMVGTGQCYAVLTFRYNTELYSGLPKVRFVMRGIPVYDPRFDTTVGGTGSQRWANRATWVASNNNAVLIYNVMRGIDIAGLGRWGGECEAEDLPLANWFAAMNECDVAIPLSAGGTEPQYRGGIEVSVDRSPFEIIEQLLLGCSGQLAEIGGVWKIRVGGPGLPVYFFDDEDLVISRPQELDPVPGLETRFNAIAASYPEPVALWEVKDAPPLYSTAWETEDGDRRLEASLQLPATPWPNQVGRVMKSYIQEERRFRRHTITLPPDAMVLEPLDAAEWSSTRNGYASKSFEISEVVDDQRRLLQTLSLRERDSGDYVWVPAYEQPYEVPSPVQVYPINQSVPGWAVAPVVLSDGIRGRRPALRLAWDPIGLDGITQLRYEIRLRDEGIASDTVGIAGSSASWIVDLPLQIWAYDLDGWAGDFVKNSPTWMVDAAYERFGRDDGYPAPPVTRVLLRGLIDDITAGEHYVTDGILPATDYEASATPVIEGPVERSAWLGATTAATYLRNEDFEGGINALFIAAGLSVPQIVGSLPVTGNYPGRLVLLSGDQKLYRWTGTVWTSAVPVSDVTGQALATDILIANSITGGLIAAAAIQAGDGIIGNLAVDTLQIGNQAVTIPVIGRSTNPVTLTSSDIYVKLLELVIVRKGYATRFDVTVQLSGYGSGVVDLVVKRGTRNVMNIRNVTGLDGRQIQVSFFGFDDDTGSGKTTYSLWGKLAPSDTTSGWNADLLIGTRALGLLQIKR